MRTATKEFKVYSYSELNQEAKEVVKGWLLGDEWRCQEFKFDVEGDLGEAFPNSDLKISFSLSSCQGDGLNIEGELDLYDILPKLEGYSEKEIKTLWYYFEKTGNRYTFVKNSRYSYSCKFIDIRYLDEYVSDAVDILRYWQYKDIDKKLLKRFYMDMLNYFQDLDKKYEENGYRYLYEMDGNEVKEICEGNAYEFFEDGSIYQKVYASKM